MTISQPARLHPARSDQPTGTLLPCLLLGRRQLHARVVDFILDTQRRIRTLSVNLGLGLSLNHWSALADHRVVFANGRQTRPGGDFWTGLLGITDQPSLGEELIQTLVQLALNLGDDELLLVVGLKNLVKAFPGNLEEMLESCIVGPARGVGHVAKEIPDGSLGVNRAQVFEELSLEANLELGRKDHVGNVWEVELGTKELLGTLGDLDAALSSGALGGDLSLLGLAPLLSGLLLGLAPLAGDLLTVTLPLASALGVRLVSKRSNHVFRAQRGDGRRSGSGLDGTGSGCVGGSSRNTHGRRVEDVNEVLLEGDSLDFGKDRRRDRLLTRSARTLPKQAPNGK